MKFLKPPLIPMVLSLGLVLFGDFSEIMCTVTVTNGTFNHPNFIIYFTGSPLPRKGLLINDIEDFLPMIEKISTEFSQISCKNKNILLAVATHNKLLSMKNVSRKPLEVYLQQTSKSWNTTTFVDDMVELADKSNDIFSGTVKYLLVYYDSFYGEEDFKNRYVLSETRKRFTYKENSTQYYLGIIFHLNDCEKATSAFLDHVQVIAFYSDIVGKVHSSQTVEDSFNKLTEQFDLCRNMIKRINPYVKLILQTRISDTDQNGKHDYFAMISFWEMINDWAVATDVKVIMFEAFDTPDRGTFDGRYGLWKLARTPRRYYIPADFIFQDKRLSFSLNNSETAFCAKNNDEIVADLNFKHDNFVVVFNSKAISIYSGEHYYHRDDVLPIIRTIADKFSSVCLHKYDPVVTEAVAIHNRMTIQNKNNLSQPLWLYQMFELNDENRLDYALNMTSNSVFGDTVKYLLSDHSDADVLFSYLTETRINQTVGLAIKLPLKDCLWGTSVRTQVIRLVSYVKLILITVETEQEDYDVGAAETVVGLTTAFTRCKEKIESLSRGQSLKIGFSSEWPDTDSHSVQNFSNFVSFWGKMNKWAKVTNTTVFMSEAFDDVSKESTYGWWRQTVKQGSYQSIQDYVYEDKTETRNKISNGIPYVGNNTLRYGNVAFPQKWKVTNSFFSPTNFIVQFNPIIRKQYIKDGFTEDKIREIILKLSTRFSSICTWAMVEADLRNSMRYVTLEVAKLNLERGLKSESQNLYLLLFVNNEDDATGTFQAALKMANRANLIFLGSVEYLIVYNDDGYLDDWDDQVNYFIKAKNWLQEASTTVSYKLGHIYSILDCGHGTNLRKDIIPLTNVLDLIIFDAHAQDIDYEAGVYESIRGFTRQFGRCKEKISRLNSSIEVAFRTSWSDTTKYQKHSPENLVLFWEKMNEWAVSTNTKVFILEAFDSQNSKTVADSKTGWWRLLREEKHDGLPKYIFEEKRAVVLENLAKKNSVGGHPKTVLISVLTALVVFALTAFSVFLFMYRRYRNKLTEARQYILTKKEEIEFFEGGPSLHSIQSTDATLSNDLVTEAHIRKYDKDYEVEQEYFKFDETSPLGSGEFGIVCKGTVTKDEQEVDVAVKLLKKSSSSEAVKGLLAEIKVMIHLGKHENIVSVIGAHTEGVRRGRVLLFTELCEKGSLENYLRELRRQNNTLTLAENETELNVGVNQGQNDELDQIVLYQNVEPLPNAHMKKVTYVNEAALNQNCLSRWSYEIANGMEFIISRKVVHADLATRNVLLTNNLTAKISDFGLSRRLYNYTNYVKTQTQPLPWKWMSPESLRRMEFNEKTDVWAFGVTLWEIHSLGDIPYPGLSWTVDFPSKLEIGLRPDEPEFNEHSIYSVMLRCWNTEPNKRPTFLELKDILSK